MAAVVLQSRPVGTLACQRDSYLRSLETEVVSCVPLTADKKRESRVKGAKKEEPEAEGLWEVEFKDSVLFPEGGCPCSRLLRHRYWMTCDGLMRFLQVAVNLRIMEAWKYWTRRLE